MLRNKTLANNCLKYKLHSKALKFNFTKYTGSNMWEIDKR